MTGHGVRAIIMLLLSAAPVLAQPALHITAPGCTSATGLDVVHGQLLVVGSTVACTFDAATLAHTATIPLPPPTSPAALVAEAAGDDFVLARGLAVNLLDGATGAVLQSFANPTPTANNSFGSAVAVYAGHVLVGDPGDNEVHVFDAATGALEYTLSVSEIAYGYALAVLGDDVLVASLGGGVLPETRIRRYDIATGAPLGLFAVVPGGPGSAGAVFGQLVIVDGNVLVGMPEADGGAVYLLDGATGSVLHTYLPPEPSVYAFGRLIRATSTHVFVRGELPAAEAVYILDLASETAVRTIRDHVPDTIFSPSQQLALLGERTIVGPSVFAVCGGVAGCGPCETCGPNGSCILAPHPTCQQMEPSGAFRLRFSDTPAPGGDVAVWKGRGQLAAGGPPDPGHGWLLFGTPQRDTDYALCVWDAGSSLLFRAEAPAEGTCGTSSCWKVRGSIDTPRGGYSYRDRDRTPDGVSNLRVIRPSPTSSATLYVRGAGAELSGRPFGLPTLPLTLPLRVQLQSLDGQCFETTHSAATSNGPERFISRSD